MTFFKKLTQTLMSLVLVVAIGVGLTACGGGSGGSSSSSSDGVPPSVYYTVTNLRDSGDGSLRAAILAVNQAPAGQYSGINFAVSGIIVLTANLPTINRKVLIDGTTAPGYVAANGPSVLLNFVTSYDGFNFYRGSEGSSMVALTIINSSTHGVTLKAKNITLRSNYIGLVSDGFPAGNHGSGVYIESSSGDNVIGTNPSSVSGAYSNVISGNRQHGIEINGSNGNTIQANIIGANPAGTAAMPNLGDGILVTAGASNNLIGGTAYFDAATQQYNNPTGNKGTVPIIAFAPPLGNLISGNTRNGVLIENRSEHNTLSGNFIGTDRTGNAAIPNLADGVLIRFADNNQLIGCTVVDQPFIYYNVVSGNGLNGIHLEDANNTTIQANFFGAAANNAGSVGNGLHGIMVTGNSTNVQVGGVIPLGNVAAGNARDGINVSGRVSGFTTFNTFGGLLAFQGAAPNLGNGLTMTSTGGNNNVRTNVFSGNCGNGIELSGDATGVTIAPNIVGPITSGASVLANTFCGSSVTQGNGLSGLLITDRANNNYIGGYDIDPSVIPQNTFSGNMGYGIEIIGNAHDNYVFNSAVGTNSARTGRLGNKLSGVFVGGSASNNYIGKYQNGRIREGNGNDLSANDRYGVEIGALATGTTVEDNCIGCNRDGRPANYMRNLFGTWLNLGGNSNVFTNNTVP